MADEKLFQGAAFAMDVQDSGFGTPDATIAALTTGDETDGFVLGDKGSGDAETGISLPSFEPDYREVAPVGGSYTEQADSLLKSLANGFSITLPLMGNAADSGAPDAGAAKPFMGIDAIWQSLGMTGANSTSPVYEYTPEYATTYSTIKLFLGNFAFVFSDCIVESGSLVFTPGGNGLLTANIKVGTFDPDSDPGFTPAIAFPTIDYGTQATLAAPVVEGVNFTYSEVRGFENLTINIGNEVEEFGDSNVDVTGLRQSQTKRPITVDGTLYTVDADPDFAFQELIRTTAPTTDMSFQLGTATGATPDTCNAVLIEVNNIQPKNLKYNRIGTETVVELSGAKATGTTGGDEFKVTYN